MNSTMYFKFIAEIRESRQARSTAHVCTHRNMWFGNLKTNLHTTIFHHVISSVTQAVSRGTADKRPVEGKGQGDSTGRKSKAPSTGTHPQTQYVMCTHSIGYEEAMI